MKTQEPDNRFRRGWVNAFRVGSLICFPNPSRGIETKGAPHFLQWGARSLNVGLDVPLVAWKRYSTSGVSSTNSAVSAAVRARIMSSVPRRIASSANARLCFQ